MAEVHLIGEIVGAEGFPSQNLFCKWGLSVGSAWEVLEGLQEGQTQVDHPQDGEFAKWSHPIDIHLACKGLQGWPKLYFQVWHEDYFGRHEPYGYGFIHVPTVPGMHQLRCSTWKPSGSFKDQFTSFFLGGNPELRSEKTIHTSGDRQRLRTEATGTVLINVGVLLRNFEKYGVEVS
ncbi:hypothetical protein EMCRGX_G034144 [Ephydatia muelleri]|eukprot:Em0786g8a